MGVSLPAAYTAEFCEPEGYLDFASTGPPSRRVRSEVDGVLGAVANPAGGVEPQVRPRYQNALAGLARLMEVPVDCVVPVPTTSAGLFQVAFGLLGSGGNVVLPAHEFPANVYPWLRAAGVGGPEARLVEIPDGRVTPERIAAAVDAGTRAVAVSLVDYLTGFRVDLDGMRRAAGEALLVVDAIQGLGAVHSGLGPADVMVAGGQKWMRAGWGSGVMAMSDRALERLAPTLTGWQGVEGSMDFERPAPHPASSGADRFQEGTPPIIGAVQMAAAVSVMEMAGVATISTVVAERVAGLEEVALRRRAEVFTPWRIPAERAGILSMRLPGEDPARTSARLAAAGLIVSRRGPWIRLSPHATSGSESVAMLGDAL